MRMNGYYSATGWSFAVRIEDIRFNIHAENVPY
jgi:hypothetical protein